MSVVEEEDIVVVLPAYDFDSAVQSEILSCLMFDGDFLRRTDTLIKAQYFENDIERIYADITITYYKKYSDAPSGTVWKELIKDAIITGRFRSDQKVDAINKLIELNKITVVSRAWLLDSIATFAKHQAVVAALIDASKQIFKTTDTDRFHKAEKVMIDAFSVALVTNDEDYDYWFKIDERTADRKDIVAGGKPKTGVTTGIAELDALLPMHQGWGRQEFTAFMAGPKASKSFMLYASAGAAVRAGHNTLIVTLENSKKVVASRLDAFFSGVGLSEEFKSPFAMEMGVKSANTADVGKLRIREAPAQTFKPSDLRRMIDDYRTKGIVFDLVVIDYTDLMVPDHSTNNAIENSKSVVIGVRQVGRENNYATLTAFQTNREGHKSATLRAEHVAEDFNKIRTADLVLGINRTDEERADGKARITIVAARNSEDGMTLFVKQDLNKGLAISEVESVE